MVSLSRILSVAPQELLRSSRQLVLEQHGYYVVSAATLEQVEAACRAGTFDLALLGWGLRPLAKLAAAEILRRFFPGITILDLCRGRSAIPGAEACNVQDPSDLLAAIALKLRDRKSRGSHPRRRLSLDRAAREEPS